MGPQGKERRRGPNLAKKFMPERFLLVNDNVSKPSSREETLILRRL